MYATLENLFLVEELAIFELVRCIMQHQLVFDLLRINF